MQGTLTTNCTTISDLFTSVLETIPAMNAKSPDGCVTILTVIIPSRTGHTHNCTYSLRRVANFRDFDTVKQGYDSVYWMLQEFHVRVTEMFPDSAIPTEFSQLPGWLGESPSIAPPGVAMSNSNEATIRTSKRSGFLCLLSLYFSPRARKSSRRASHQAQQPMHSPKDVAKETSTDEQILPFIHSQESVPRFHDHQYAHHNISNDGNFELSFNMGMSTSSPVISSQVDYSTSAPQATFVDEHYYNARDQMLNGYVDTNNEHYTYSSYETPAQYGLCKPGTNGQQCDQDIGYSPYYSPTENQQNHEYGHQKY